jgi:hypothetical protein
MLISSPPRHDVPVKDSLNLSTHSPSHFCKSLAQKHAHAPTNKASITTPPAVHVPLTVQAPPAPHVATGVPLNPVAQRPVQVPPKAVAGQLHAAFEGTVGAAVHVTAAGGKGSTRHVDSQNLECTSWKASEDSLEMNGGHPLHSIFRRGPGNYQIHRKPQPSTLNPTAQAHSLITQAPEAAPHTPVGKQVDEGVGLPVKPVAQVARQTVPTLTPERQLKFELARVGWPVHTAGRQAGRQAATVILHGVRGTVPRS